MADTMRSLSDITTLLADNNTGAISAQDLRDALISTVQPGHGEISITASTATTIAEADTWYQVAGTYALSSPAMNWNMDTNGRLEYEGAADRVVHIAMSLSMTAASNQVNTEWAIGANGTAITPSIVRRYVQTGNDVGSTALHAFTTVSNGDYLCAMVRNATSATNITATYLNLFVMDMAS